MLISDYGACSNCLATPGVKDDDVISYVDLPIHNLLFDGQENQAARLYRLPARHWHPVH